MSFSEKIQNLRKESGDSQTSLADKLSVSRQAISKWERGDSTPDVDKVLTICQYFKVSPDFLLLEVQPNVTDEPEVSTKAGSSRLTLVASLFSGVVLGAMVVYFVLSSAQAEPEAQAVFGQHLEEQPPEIIEIYKEAEPIALNEFTLDSFYNTALDFRLDLLPVFEEKIANITLSDLLEYMSNVTGLDTFTDQQVEAFALKHFGLENIEHQPVAYEFNYSVIDGMGTYVASKDTTTAKPISVLKSFNSDPINNKYVAVYDVYYPTDINMSQIEQENLYKSFKESGFSSVGNLSDKQTFLISYTVVDNETKDLTDDYLLFTSVKTLI